MVKHNYVYFGCHLSVMELFFCLLPFLKPNPIFEKLDEQGLLVASLPSDVLKVFQPADSSVFRWTRNVSADLSKPSFRPLPHSSLWDHHSYAGVIPIAANMSHPT